MTDNSMGHDRQFLLSFAQTEFFEIAKERNRFQLLAIGIMGVVILILISLLSIEAQPNEPNISKDILSLILTGLSFVYFLLGLRFVHHSRRHDQIVIYLTNTLSECLRYLNVPKNVPSVTKFTWRFINFMIFIFPGIGCFAIAGAILWIADTPWRFYVLIVWCLFLVLDIVLLAAILRMLGRVLPERPAEAVGLPNAYTSPGR